MEIIVTMAIISVMLAGAALFLGDNDDNRVNDIAQKTQILAKETLREAKSKDRAQSIFISYNSMWVAPESELSSDSDEETEKLSLIEIPEDIVVSYKRFGETVWTTITKSDPPFIWTFTQSGLCDNVSISFETEDAVNQMSFHPLTAGELADDY